MPDPLIDLRSDTVTRPTPAMRRAMAEAEGGGAFGRWERGARVEKRARERGLGPPREGARLWNACAATGHKPADYARHFDTVSCCFSKGLGAPAGSAVAGDKPTIARVFR